MNADTAMTVDVELSGDAKNVVALSNAMRKLGRLEARLPEAYVTLRKAKDEDLRSQIDHVFRLLLTGE